MTTPTDTPEQFQEYVDTELTDEQREWLTGEGEAKTEEARNGRRS